MNLVEYKIACLRTATFEGTETEKVFCMCLGIAGESGEIVDYIKKVGFHGHHFYKEKLMKEMGDLLWYVTVLANYFGIDLEQVLDMNIEKLKQRYPDGFSKERSINRKEQK